MAQRRTVLFSGEVQGVGFRATACRLVAQRPVTGCAAGGRGFPEPPVTGYVRNLPDGRVELVVEGAPDQIDALLGDLRSHFGDRIHQAAGSTTSATGEFVGFGIRR